MELRTFEVGSVVHFLVPRAELLHKRAARPTIRWTRRGTSWGIVLGQGIKERNVRRSPSITAVIEGDTVCINWWMGNFNHFPANKLGKWRKVERTATDATPTKLFHSHPPHPLAGRFPRSRSFSPRPTTTTANILQVCNNLNWIMQKAL